MRAKYKTKHKTPKVTVKPLDGNTALDAELLAFISRTARENRFEPSENPVLRDFRKRMGILKMSY